MVLNMGVVNAKDLQINYIKSLNAENITVSGNVINGANKDVFLRIEYADNNLLSDTESLEACVVYQKQSKTDDNGSFEFNVKLKDNGESSYTLRLGVLGNEKDISETFVFYGTGYRNEAISAIQTAQKNKDSQALAEAITTYYTNLYLHTPLFNEYYSTDADLSQTKSLLVNYPLIKDVAMLEEALEGVVVVKDLKVISSLEDMTEVFKKYDSELGILESTIYNLTYQKMSDELKEDSCSSFKNKSFYTPSEIKESFTLSVLNTYLANAVGAGSVKTVLSDNAQLFGIDMKDYKLSDSKFLELIGTEFKAVADIKTKLDSLNNQTSSNQGGSGSGGSSGGGGGYSGSPVASTVGQTTVTGNLNTERYPFSDMENYVWAKEATLALYKSGVLDGVGENKFAPERVITREEFLKLIINGFEITAPTDNDTSFTDVNKEMWYYPFVKTALNSGVVNGMDDNTFGIGNQITRQDMVVMLYRAIDMKREISDAAISSAFEDYSSVADYAKNAVAFAEANDIVNGMGDGNFHPYSFATRAEAAVILYRAINYLSEGI